MMILLIYLLSGEVPKQHNNARGGCMNSKKACSIFFFLLMTLMAHCTHAREVDFCLAKDKAWDSGKHIALMKELGMRCATVYYSLNAPENLHDPFKWVQLYLDYGYKVIMVLRIDADGKNPLTSTLIGENDVALETLRNKIEADGRPITIRLWHESDGNWYPWQIYYKDKTTGLQNGIDMHLRAYRYLTEKLALKNVSFESNFNRRNANEVPLGEGEKYLPHISALVHYNSVSSYNRCGTRKKYRPEGVLPGEYRKSMLQFEYSFESEFDPFYQKALTLIDEQKPINIAEVSTSGLCTQGEKIPWFTAMLESIDQKYPRVQTITFVFGDVAIGEASNDVLIPWGIDSEEQRQRFATLLNKYRTRWGMKEIEPKKSKSTKLSDFLRGGASRTPWSVFAKVQMPFSEVTNNAINSISGEQFDKSGFVFQGLLKQSWLYQLDNGLEFGPSIHMGIMQSLNQNQWWYNNIYTGGTIGIYLPVPRGEYIRWGTFSLEFYGYVRKDTTPNIPENLKGFVPTVGTQFSINGGGDWSN